MEKEKFWNFTLWDLVKAISTLVVVGVASYKLFAMPASLNMDFPTLLSLLLALFSVALSALFYFKATDTSNAFYDNTYKFTKDIAELLVKIESGFGERLRHLDEGYSSMRNYFQNVPPKQADDVERTKKKLENEEQEVEKVLIERNAIIQQLVEKSQLQQEEKSRVLDQLRAKEEELAKLQNEVNRLTRRVVVEKMNKKSGAERFGLLPSSLADYTAEKVVQKMGGREVADLSLAELRHRFTSLINELPRGYLRDLESHDLFDDGLTPAGVRFVRDLAAGRGTP
ncbi:MAG: hypothetical protein JWN73_3298 [Betaproteobacteria bacterium]|nr:hypothetical protein [Betaproteobacteria bacterium]